jgi:hypothetical protein
MVPHGFNIRASARRVLAVAGMGALIAVAHACSRPPLLAPSGTAITLVSQTNVLPVNGSTDITAILIEGGQSTTTQGGNSNTTTTPGVGTPVHNGTTVTFTTTLGRIEPAEASTSNGQAVVKLIGDGRSGVATITALSGPASKTLTVNIGAAGAARLVVTANPQTLNSPGGNSVITANVQDQQGNGLLGVPVSFSTSAGTLSSGSAISDAQGNASTTLSTTAATATVTATSGGGTGTLTATVPVTVKPRTTITLTPPASATVSTPAAFSVTVGANTNVTDVTINFGDGQKESLGAVSTTAGTSHLYGNSGSFNVVATATDSDNLTTSVSSSVSVAPLTAAGAANPGTTTLGNPVVITVSPSTGALIDHYEYDFNEGDSPTSTPSNSISHVFKQRGTNQVNIKVVPRVGSSFTIFVQVVIT